MERGGRGGREPPRFSLNFELRISDCGMRRPRAASRELGSGGAGEQGGNGETEPRAPSAESQAPVSISNAEPRTSNFHRRARTSASGRGGGCDQTRVEAPPRQRERRGTLAVAGGRVWEVDRRANGPVRRLLRKHSVQALLLQHPGDYPRDLARDFLAKRRRNSLFSAANSRTSAKSRTGRRSQICSLTSTSSAQTRTKVR